MLGFGSEKRTKKFQERKKVEKKKIFLYSISLFFLLRNFFFFPLQAFFLFLSSFSFSFLNFFLSFISQPFSFCLSQPFLFVGFSSRFFFFQNSFIVFRLHLLFIVRLIFSLSFSPNLLPSFLHLHFFSFPTVVFFSFIPFKIHSFISFLRMSFLFKPFLSPFLSFSF